MKSVQEAARAHTVDAIETLAQIMQDKRQAGAARVAAANSLLHSGRGEAPATVDVNGRVTLEALAAVAVPQMSAGDGVAG